MAGKDEEEASILIGVKGKETHLFEMETSDYSFFPFEYTAIGTGSAQALGHYIPQNIWMFINVGCFLLNLLSNIALCKGPISFIFC